MQKRLRLLTTAKAISLLGDMIFLVGLPLLVYQQTGSATSVAFSLGFEIALYTIFSLLGGSLADQFDGRQLCILLDALRGVLLVAVTLALQFQFELWLVICLSGLMGIMNAIYNAAFDSLPVHYFEGSQQADVTAKFQTINHFALTLGLGIAGSIIGIIGPMSAIYLNAASFIISGVVLFFLPTIHREHHRHSNLLKGFAIDVREGFSILHKVPEVWNTLLMAFALNVAIGSKEAVWISLLKSEFSVSDALVGWINALVGLAFILSTIGFKRWNAANRKNQIQLVIYAQVFGFIGLILLGFHSNLGISIFAAMILGAASSMHSLASTSMRRTMIPASHAGRSLAAARVVSRLAAPVAIFGVGFLLSSTSIQNVLLIYAVVLLILSLKPAFQLAAQTLKPDKANVPL